LIHQRARPIAHPLETTHWQAGFWRAQPSHPPKTCWNM
jgi:hypothetical protein